MSSGSSNRRRSTRTTKAKEMRKRGYSLDESGEWVQRKKKTERQELREEQDEAFEKGKAEDLRKRQLEEFENQLTAVMLSPSKESVHQCLTAERHLRESVSEEENQRNRSMLIQLASSMVSQWLNTGEGDLRDLVCHVAESLLKEDDVHKVRSFMHIVECIPDINDYNYRHKIRTIALNCGEILNMDFMFVVAQKKEEWIALQASARPSTGRT